MTAEVKAGIIRELVECLSGEPEIEKIVVFGSFMSKTEPNDLDVAIFQDSNESYLPLAMKYAHKTHSVSKRIPMDIIPVRPNPSGFFLDEILRGEVVYER